MRFKGVCRLLVDGMCTGSLLALCCASVCLVAKHNVCKRTRGAQEQLTLLESKKRTVRGLEAHWDELP